MKHLSCNVISVSAKEETGIDDLENEIKNIEILGHIPDGLVYAEYNEKAFSYWSETYTVLEGKVADENII